MFEIGAPCAKPRRAQALTLQQVEDDTKIRVKYIQAMENEDFDVMPGPTYVKGFLRTYATYLGLDPDIILDEYRSRVEPNAGRTSPSAASRPSAGRGPPAAATRWRSSPRLSARPRRSSTSSGATTPGRARRTRRRSP